MPEPDLKALATDIADRIWNKADFDVIDTHFAPDFVAHLPGQPPVRGRAAFRKMAEEMRATLPDLAERMVLALRDGDRVFLQAVLTGTQRGELMGLPPTGLPTRLTEMNILRFEDGKVAELWQQADYLGVLEQLGVTPPRDAGPLGQVAHTLKLMARFGYLKAKSARQERKAA